jgi:hypothetical protein
MEMEMGSNAPAPGCGNQKPKKSLRNFEIKTGSPESVTIVVDVCSIV